MNLEELLSMKVHNLNAVTGEQVSYPPEFRVSVQGRRDGGVHFIIHANGYNSETLDFVAKGDKIERLFQPPSSSVSKSIPVSGRNHLRDQ